MMKGWSSARTLASHGGQRPETGSVMKGEVESSIPSGSTIFITALRPIGALEPDMLQNEQRTAQAIVRLRRQLLHRPNSG